MRKRILIVDDDVLLCNALAMLIREEGYLVEHTSNSEEGALLIENNMYDVCLFDYKMKGLNGIDLLKIVRTRNRQCTVLIVTGVVDVDTLRADENVVRLGASIISKPFDMEAVFQQMKGDQQHALP